MYPQMKNLSLRDAKLRSFIYYLTCTVILSVVSVLLFPSIAGSSPIKENEGKLTYLVLGIEFISKHLMNTTTDTVNYMIDGSSRTWVEFAKYKATWIIIHIVITFVETILFCAMVLPVCITQLNFSELQNVVIFGFLFPAFRFNFIILKIQNNLIVIMLN